MAQGFSRRRAILVDPDTGEPLSVKDRVLQTSDPKARQMAAKVWLELRNKLELLRPPGLEEGLGISVKDVGKTKKKISQLGDEVEWLPLPEFMTGGAATRASQANYDGAAYLTSVPIEFDRFLFRPTIGGTGRLRFSFFQSKSGGGGPAYFLTTGTSLGGSAATFTVDVAKATLQPGVFYVLWGHIALTAITLQTWAVGGATELVTANVDSSTHRTIFTTTIDADTIPDQFDPRDQTISTVSVAPVLRLIKRSGLE